MVEWLTTIFAGGMVITATALVALRFWPRAHPARMRRVLVNLDDPQADALRGVLRRADGDWLVLANTELVRGEGEAVRLDGEIVLERSRVLFVQVLS